MTTIKQLSFSEPLESVQQRFHTMLQSAIETDIEKRKNILSRSYAILLVFVVGIINSIVSYVYTWYWIYLVNIGIHLLVIISTALDVRKHLKYKRTVLSTEDIMSDPKKLAAFSAGVHKNCKTIDTDLVQVLLCREDISAIYVDRANNVCELLIGDTTIFGFHPTKINPDGFDSIVMLNGSIILCNSADVKSGLIEETREVNIPTIHFMKISA